LEAIALKQIPLSIDKLAMYPLIRLELWASLMEQSQGSHSRCGIGGLLFLNASNFFRLKESLGGGTNNISELFALKLFLIFAVEKGVFCIEFFGDLIVIIKWLKGENKMLNLNLGPVFEGVQLFQAAFNIISFSHVDRENNQETGSLFKVGQLLNGGTWLVLESREDHILESVRCFHV